MRSKLKLISATVVFSLFFAAFNAVADTADESIISVTGEAEIFTVPDEINISMTVEVNGKDLSVAQDENDAITNRLIKIAKKDLKIEDKYIQTNYINVRPVYHRQSPRHQISSVCEGEKCGGPAFSHFETKKGFLITLKDVSLLQDLLEKALEAGVTRIDNVQFVSSKTDELKKEARILAAKNAKENASEVAEALGVKLGDPKRIHVNQSNIVNFRNDMYAGSRAMMASMESVSSKKTVSIGQVSVKSMVRVDFEIE